MADADSVADLERLLAHAGWMKALARRLLGDEGLSADAVQDTWLAYLRRPPRHVEATRSWLRRVLVNFAARTARSQAHRRKREEAAARAEASPETPDELIERADLLRRISEMVLELEEPYRSTLLLHYFEERSPAEIARRQSVSAGAVYSRLRRAVEQLRARLDREHGGRGAWRVVLLPLAGWGLGMPASAAEGASAVEGASAAEGATAAEAASSAAAAPAASGWGGGALGGIALATKKKIGIVLLTSLGLFLAGGGLYLGTRDGGPGPASPRTGPEGPVVSRLPAGEREAGPEAQVAAGRVPIEDRGAVGVPAGGAANPSIAGRVLDPGGRPIAGAEVTALHLADWNALFSSSAEGIWNRREGELSASLKALSRGLRERAGASPRAESDARGRYALHGLGEGEHRLLARHPGFLPGTDQLVLVVVPGATESRDIELAPALSISGRVAGETGKPLHGASVRVLPAARRSLSGEARRDALLESWQEGGLLVEAPAALTGPGGEFRLGSLAPDLYDVVADSPGCTRSVVHDVPAGTEKLELTLTRGLVIRGVVLASGRRPLAGAEILLEPLPEAEAPALALGRAEESWVADETLLDAEGAPSVRTDGAGRFELTGLAEAAYRVAVAFPGRPGHERRVDLREEDGDLGDLVLEDGGAIAGVVVDARGLPVPGTRLWIEKRNEEGIPDWGGRFFDAQALVETRSGPDGQFRLEGLAGGVFTVHAASRRHLEAELRSVRAGQEELLVTLQEGQVVRGRVVDGTDRRPVPGAEVVATRGLRQLPAAEKLARTDADGAFELLGLSMDDRRLGLRVSHPDYPGTPVEREIEMDDLKQPVTVELQAPDWIAGRVLDAQGNPVVSARVSSSLHGLRSSFKIREAAAGGGATRTDGEGRFVLTVPRSARLPYVPLEVAASHPTLGSGRVFPAEKPADGKPWPEVTVTIQAASSLAGRIQGNHGRPLARATVRARRMFTGGGTEKRYGLDALGYSAEDGSYSLARLEPGAYEVEVRALGWAALQVEDIEIGAEPRREDFTLEAGRTIAGTVVDSLGAPVPGARVLAFKTIETDTRSDYHTETRRWNRRHNESGFAAGRTDASGAFALAHLVDRPWTLVARAPGHAPSPLAVVGPGASPPPLVLSPLTGLSGEVVDAATGLPVQSFTVWLKRVNEEPGRSSETCIPREYNDPAGGFRFDSLLPGRYAVEVRAPGYPQAGQWTEVAPREHGWVRFALEPGRTLVGVVRDVETGAVIPGASVNCFRRSERADWQVTPNMASHATSGVDGSFRIEGISPGRHAVEPHHPDYTLEEKLRLEVGDTDPPPLEIRLRAAGKVVVNIENFANRKRLLARLVLKPLDRTGEGYHAYEERGRAGEFRGASIPPGRYEVTLHEEVPGPAVPEDATTFRREDMVERTTRLGEVEVRRGEVSTLHASVSPDPGRG